MMKASRYNKIMETKDGIKLAFNSFSCSLAEVDENFIDILENVDKIDYSDLKEDKKELIDNMLLGNFIVHNDIEELKLLKYRHLMGKFNTDNVGLTIAPTLACNFACPYCYETAKSGMMEKEVQDAIVGYIEKKAKLKKNINVGWYGGEPLLGKNIIVDLSRRIIEICERYEVKYGSSIVTNGYLLDDEVINELVKARVSSAQITIDGPPQIHNQRRRLKKKNEDTFYVLIKNIKKVIENNINVSIRVNIDKTNSNCIDELLDILEESGLKQGVNIYFGHVDSSTEACQSIASSCLNRKEYAEFDIKYHRILKQRGFISGDYKYYPNGKTNYCGSDSISGYVVDPDGYLYKCWNDVGNIKFAVGNIKEMSKDECEENFSRENDSKKMNMVNNVMWTPFEIEECRECNFLPICMGGCPYNAKVRQNSDQKNCEKWKYIIEEVMLQTYEDNI